MSSEDIDDIARSLDPDQEHPSEAETLAALRAVTKSLKRKREGEGDEEEQKRVKKKKKREKEGPEGQNEKSHSFAFTWNNYTAESIDTILRIRRLQDYAVQEEEESCKHLQGVIRLSSKRTIWWLRQFTLDYVHWEVCIDFKNSVRYCTREDKRRGRIWTSQGVKDLLVKKKTKRVKKPKKKPKKKVTDPMEGKVMYQYQKEILSIIKEDPSERKVLWYYSTKGNCGKSAICKHLVLKHGAQVVGGKFADAYFAISKAVEEGNDPPIIIFDLPRSMGNKVSYIALEKIKDGMFFSSKYEASMCVFNTPHLFVFANCEPDRYKLTGDRWIIVDIDDEIDAAGMGPPLNFSR